FRTRQQLMQVPRLGPKAFEQCAGFLRIRGGDDPLDASGVHPEAYPVVRRILTATGGTAAALIGSASALRALKPDQFTDDRFGLVHESALSRDIDSDPRSVLKAGDVVRVKVLSVDIARHRISLTLRLDDDGRPFSPSSRTGRAARPASGPGGPGRKPGAAPKP